MFQKPSESTTEYYLRVDLCRSRILEKLATEVSDTMIEGRKITTKKTALERLYTSVFFHRITDRVVYRIRGGVWFIMKVCTCTGHLSREQFTPDVPPFPLGAKLPLAPVRRKKEQSSTPVYWCVLTLPDVLPVFCKLSAAYLRS